MVLVPDYLIRQDGHNRFTISKWEGSKKPSSVYQILGSRAGVKCNCPGYLHNSVCKHIDILNKWFSLGRPEMKLISHE